MQAYLPWIWLGLIALFGVLEGATLQLVSIWFCVGSFAALAASLLGAEAWLQFVVFAVVSALARVVSRTLFRDRLRPRRVPTNADMVIGKEGVVLRDISPDETGRVKVDGQDWSARCATPLTAGDRCRVESISGVTLTVVPCDSEQKEESVCCG